MKGSLCVSVLLCHFMSEPAYVICLSLCVFHTVSVTIVTHINCIIHDSSCRCQGWSSDQYPLIVSQDCNHQRTADVIRQYGDKLTHIKVREKEGEREGGRERERGKEGEREGRKEREGRREGKSERGEGGEGESACDTEMVMVVDIMFWYTNIIFIAK